MKGFDVILLITSKSMTHTKARRDATNTGAKSALSAIPSGAQVVVAPHNPILDYKPELPLKEWNQEIEQLWKDKGLAQWELANYLENQKKP